MVNITTEDVSKITDDWRVVFPTGQSKSPGTFPRLLAVTVSRCPLRAAANSSSLIP